MAGEEESEKVRRLAELKALLEKRVKEAETELEGLQVLLEYVDKSLLEKGFRKAKMLKPPPTTMEKPPIRAGDSRVVPLKTVGGDLLANLFIAENMLRVVLSDDKSLDINTPPFMSFLVERVLTKMQEKDREAVERGEITPDKILSYDIARDGDEIQEITIKNVVPERSRELKSTIRWTLEKMHEKAQAD
ncbi:MAG: hypothetical protein JSW53_04910 [Candidatus Bathyarchaeota archaeon]|nr:MAG: hypothetical protein JSW53_04910 [Candidatus Bathyarchaeota archaeon]